MFEANEFNKQANNYYQNSIKENETYGSQSEENVLKLDEEFGGIQRIVFPSTEAKHNTLLELLCF